MTEQTVWSVEEAINRNHVDLPRDGVTDEVGNSVIEGFDSASEFLSRNKERPNG